MEKASRWRRSRNRFFRGVDSGGGGGWLLVLLWSAIALAVACQEGLCGDVQARAPPLCLVWKV